MKDDIKEGCRGCIDSYKNDHYGFCVSPSTFPGFIENCPCKMCLIKGMCTVSCDDFKNHFKNEMAKCRGTK